LLHFGGCEHRVTPSRAGRIRSQRSRSEGGEFQVWQIYGNPPSALPPNHAALFREVALSLSDVLGWDDEDQKPFGSAVFALFEQG
jgi:hypothetical protein